MEKILSSRSAYSACLGTKVSNCDRKLRHHCCKLICTHRQGLHSRTCAGNHGEDAKEYWWYEDNIPSHAYMRASYLYPMVKFPYGELVEGNAQRNREEPELELMEACGTETWDRSLFWLVTVEYAKAGQRDIVQRITARNASEQPQELHMLPTAYFRNTWSWGYNGEMPWVAEVKPQGPLGGSPPRPPPVVAGPGGRRTQDPRAASAAAGDGPEVCKLLGWERHLGLVEMTTSAPVVVDASGATVPGAASFAAKSRCKDSQQGAALVTDNNTNFAAVWGEDGNLLNPAPAAAAPCNLWEDAQACAAERTWFSKDGIQEAVLHADGTAVKPTGNRGTKAAVWAHGTVPPGGELVLVTRLRVGGDQEAPPPAVRPAPGVGGDVPPVEGGSFPGEGGGAAVPPFQGSAFLGEGHEADSGEMGGPTIPQTGSSSSHCDIEGAASQGGSGSTPCATVPDSWYSTPASLAYDGQAVGIASMQAAGLRNQLSISSSELVITQRKSEADEFYDTLAPSNMSAADRSIQRQAFAGLLWGKQYYHFGVAMWLKGDPSPPPPPPQRAGVRNSDWSHMYCSDVISMPDKWEYPWFASWDLAFHMIPLALIDADWAKRQLLLVMREWYMHPSGQLPAYEWDYGDTNPPVHAWAVLRVFRIDRKQRSKAAARVGKAAAGGSGGSPSTGGGRGMSRVPSSASVASDTHSTGTFDFINYNDGGASAAGSLSGGGRAHPLADSGDYTWLERAFHKLLLNFTWWVNRKDSDGQNLFEGGFLGLDNIGVFNRSDPELWKSTEAEDGLWRKLEQADATAWVAMFCLNMLEISLELALYNRAYEDIASKFLEHFVTISARITGNGEVGDSGLWDEETGFFYDRLRTSKDGSVPPEFVRLRSFVGLIPLYAVTTISASTLRALPSFARRLQWFMRHRRAMVQAHLRWWGPQLQSSDADSPCVVQDPETGLVVHSLATCSVERFATWVMGAGHASEHVSHHTSVPQMEVGSSQDFAIDAEFGEEAMSAGNTGTLLLSLVSPEQLTRLVERLCDTEQFMSPYGLRSLSKEYEAAPFHFTHGSFSSSVAYGAAESTSPMFGGNSSWRGPVWFPVRWESPACPSLE